MKKSMSMHKCQPRKDLYQNDFYRILGKMSVPVFYQLVKIFVHILKDKVKNVIFSNNFLQFHHIGMG